jgi:UDP-glucose 4-epimerase
MTVIVTGASGFVGSHTVKTLLERGYNVTGIDVKPLDLKHKNLKKVQCDIVSPELASHINQRDKVLHLAAVSTFGSAGQDPAKAVRVNVEGTLNVIRSCIEKKAERLVFSSTGGVYHKHSSIPIKEDSPRNPTSIYGLTKKQAEDWIILYGDQIDYVILRYAYIYGQGKNWGAIGSFIKRIKRGEPPVIFGGRQTNDFIYIKDIVEANILALESEYLDQVYNIGTGTATSIKETCRLCLQTMHSNLEMKVQPPRPFDIQMFVYDITKARLLLGFEPKCKLP